MPTKKSIPKVRVRFPPSPTGFLHIGSLRTALYNYLFARKMGGTFLLRIEDTDRARTVEGGVENIKSTLKWCGLNWDEGPYTQSERLPIYKEHAEKLLATGNAYYCICTAERLEEVRQTQIVNKQAPRYDGKCRSEAKLWPAAQHESLASSVIRLKVPENGTTTFTDLVHGEMSFENKLIDDQVLMKSDGYPTYHLANVVDDHLMEVTHVMRGEEWLSSTPKHVLLYKAFGWEPPSFAHLPLLLNSDHSKLSKRQGDVAVEDYIKKGYLREALLNFVALLGWNPRADKELYTLDELIAEFDISKVNKSGAVVNFEKLDWMNGHYLRAKSVEELTQLCVPYLREAGRIKQFPISNFQFLMKIVALEQERMRKLSDIVAATDYFFIDQPLYEPVILVWKKTTKETVVPALTELNEFLLNYKSNWDAENLEREIKVWITAQGRGVGEILWPLRVALSGREASPPPFPIAAILGKEKSLQRIQYAIKLASAF